MLLLVGLSIIQTAFPVIGGGGAGARPSCHWVKGRVQVTSPSPGCAFRSDLFVVCSSGTHIMLIIKCVLSHS